LEIYVNHSIGACYIETSSLDGEKNLKPRSALIETQNLFKQVNGNYSEVQLKARPPTPSLGDYEGSIQIK
jgi:phospholipid-transporting ATPase